MSTTNDTLVMNQQVLEQLQEDYNYNQDLGHKDNPELETQPVRMDTPDINASDWSTSFKVFSIVFTCILVLAAFGYILYKRYLVVEEKKVIELPEEDTIYGIDFENSIDAMEIKGNYFQCIRLSYLQLLRHLHDNRKILWLPSKTPTQYVSELNSDDFRKLTNIFLKVRYGNYPADATLYAEVCVLIDNIEDVEKGGAL